jgi:hypothetical protein
MADLYGASEQKPWFLLVKGVVWTVLQVAAVTFIVV